MDLHLRGKHAIVTGGSRGIGKAIARELATEGVDLVIAARNRQTLESTASELSAETGRRVIPVVADTGSEQSVDELNVGGLAIRRTGRPVATLRNVGVAAITKNLADELGPKGINVVAVHPGATRTERTDPTSEKQLAASVSIGRIVDASEVAWVVAFLASPRSVAINGDAIPIGGGSIGATYY
jgi:NAD(P)-dependent dehydrogenase (short-subunit alcohol dehydrogenase family)